MQAKHSEDNGTKHVTNRNASLLSNMGKKQTVKGAAKTVKATQADSTQAAAVKLSLDATGKHARRVKMAALGVDEFALFALKGGKVSDGYAAQCAAVAKAGNAGKVVSSAWLVCGGVANLVNLHEGGVYSRAHSQDGKELTVFGNVDSLVSLYGAAAVKLITREELAKLVSEAKELVTVKVGGGKVKDTVTGVVVSEVEQRFAIGYALGNGKYAIRCGEYVRNVHNYAVRASLARG